jgi:hypothetical protein
LGWAILVGMTGLVVAAVPLLPFGAALGTRFATAAEEAVTRFRDAAPDGLQCIRSGPCHRSRHRHSSAQ